jgi:hypothetical protein
VTVRPASALRVAVNVAFTVPLSGSVTETDRGDSEMVRSESSSRMMP